MAMNLVSGSGHRTGLVFQSPVTQSTWVCSGGLKQLPEAWFQLGESPPPVPVTYPSYHYQPQYQTQKKTP